ncbi:MAG: hypothetical protein IT181_14535 [Acidobacteria bacterium]|nr:hypothetical protein [Acidobacteriota bacterium]
MTLAAASNGAVQQLRDGIIALTAARFGRVELDESSLDQAVSAAGPLARSLAFRYSWPMVQWRKVTSALSNWKGRA